MRVQYNTIKTLTKNHARNSCLILLTAVSVPNLVMHLCSTSGTFYGKTRSAARYVSNLHRQIQLRRFAESYIGICRFYRRFCCCRVRLHYLQLPALNIICIVASTAARWPLTLLTEITTKSVTTKNHHRDYLTIKGHHYVEIYHLTYLFMNYLDHLCDTNTILKFSCKDF